MYAIIDGIEYLGSLGGAIYAIVDNKWYVGVSCGVFWLIYPFINQLIYNASVKLLGTQQVYRPSFRSRLVYTSDYNLSFCGLQKLHPFDSQKYGNVIAKLESDGMITQRMPEKPTRIPRSLLLQKVSQWYLIRMCYSSFLSKYIQMPFCLIPSFLLRWRVLNPMLLATEGTLIACEIANRMKWAINLSGGYHHASTKTGGGFCVYPDITLAVHYIRTRLSKKKIMIIDLDAHQGNGYERDLLEDDNTFIVDYYNHSIYPGDSEAKEAIDLDVKVMPFTSDFDYLNSLKKIQQAIETFRPEFIIYNAGTDTLEGDPLGRLSLTRECLIKRDEYIINLGVNRKIPVVMVLSGGYQRTNAEVIAQSIKNLAERYGEGQL